MDMVWWVLLESRLVLSAVLFVVVFFALVWWRRGGNRNVFLGVLGGAVLLLVLEALVVTNRERADGLLRQVEQAVVRSEPEALRAALSPYFMTREPEMDRERFIAFAAERLRVVDVRNLYRRKLELESSFDDGFAMRVTYFATVVGGGTSGASLLSEWVFRFGQFQDEWRITDITPAQIHKTRFESWEHVMHPVRRRGG